MSRRDGGLDNQEREEFPWRAWMRTALGGLGWRPADFWAATMTEFFEAIDGKNESVTGKRKVGAPTENEMAALLERYG